MKTNDLFKNNRSSKKINESIAKTFGKKLNLESFDLPRLEDARNKLRTQLHGFRSSSNFNENLENDAYHQAQWMLDAINAEIAEREEFIADAGTADAAYEEGFNTEVEDFFHTVANSNKGYDMLYNAMGGDYGKEVRNAVQDMYDNISREYGYHADDDFEDIYDKMMDQIESDYADRDSDPPEEGEPDEDYGTFPESTQGEGWQNDPERGAEEERAKKFQWDTDSNETAAQHKEVWTDMIADLVDSRNITIPTDEEQLRRLAVKIDKKLTEPGYSSPDVAFIMSVLSDMANDQKAESQYYESKKEENMKQLKEGEIQQAQSIVTAKTMVDRVGRWIEELSGMENDTLLQLGDQIRDEMSQEQAKSYISTVAPAIQQALENLKSTRETLATGVRQLTGEEQGAEMLGAQPEESDSEEMPAEEPIEPAEPDAMNTGSEFADEFAAADAAAGGAEAAGREKRESIDFQNRLLKVLAG